MDELFPVVATATAAPTVIVYDWTAAVREPDFTCPPPPPPPLVVPPPPPPPATTK